MVAQTCHFHRNWQMFFVRKILCFRISPSSKNSCIPHVGEHIKCKAISCLTCIIATVRASNIKKICWHLPLALAPCPKDYIFLCGGPHFQVFLTTFDKPNHNIQHSPLQDSPVPCGHGWPANSSSWYAVRDANSPGSGWHIEAALVAGTRATEVSCLKWMGAMARLEPNPLCWLILCGSRDLFLMIKRRAFLHV